VQQEGGPHGQEQPQGLKSLEHELAYLGGLCAASLMNKSLRLPRSSQQAVTGTGSGSRILSYPATFVLDGFSPYESDA
jgi:hypothetical protein